MPRHRLERLMRQHGAAIAGADLRRGAQRLQCGRTPDRIRPIKRRIVDLPVVEIRKLPGAVLHDLKALVRADNLRAAVLVLQAKLRQQRLTVRFKLGFGLHHIINMGTAPHRPAGGHDGAELVFSSLQPAGFIDHILQIGGIIRKAWGEIIRIDAPAIQIQVKNAHTGHGNAEIGGSLLQRKAAAEHHRRRGYKTFKSEIPVADPLSLPREAQPPGPEQPLRRSFLSRVVPGGNAHGVGLEGLQRGAAVLDVELFPDFLFPAVYLDRGRPES